MPGDGQDVFTYTVRDADGDLTSTTLTINIDQFVAGSNDNNTITGGAGNDVMLGDQGGIKQNVTAGTSYNIALVLDLSDSMNDKVGFGLEQADPPANRQGRAQGPAGEPAGRP